MQGDVCRAAVESALSLGYRHIDTAECMPMRSRSARRWRLGRRAQGPAMSHKVWHENLAPDSIRRAFDTSLNKLRLDHVDLYLVHWPQET